MKQYANSQFIKICRIYSSNFWDYTHITTITVITFKYRIYYLHDNNIHRQLFPKIQTLKPFSLKSLYWFIFFSFRIIEYQNTIYIQVSHSFFHTEFFAEAIYCNNWIVVLLLQHFLLVLQNTTPNPHIQKQIALTNPAHLKRKQPDMYTKYILQQRMILITYFNYL